MRLGNRLGAVRVRILVWLLSGLLSLAQGQMAATGSGSLPSDDNAAASRRGADPAAPDSAAPRPAPALAPIIKPVIKPAPAESDFQWRPALSQSFRFLMSQHAFRFMTEPGTRSELKGPFFRDYLRSVGDLDHWHDGDPFMVNYIGHPMMGAVTGYIQRQNDPRFRAQNFGKDPAYWRSVARSFAWSAVYSTQFEIGPLSESSLGNSGKIKGTQGFVDLVVTPTFGTGWMIGEDALDRYLIRRVERATDNRWVKLAVRTGLNPSRAFANLMRGKVPWHRDDREGVSRPAMIATAP
jgi:hypothetical protein